MVFRNSRGAAVVFKMVFRNSRGAAMVFKMVFTNPCGAAMVFRMVFRNSCGAATISSPAWFAQGPPRPRRVCSLKCPTCPRPPLPQGWVRAVGLLHCLPDHAPRRVGAPHTAYEGTVPWPQASGGFHHSWWVCKTLGPNRWREHMGMNSPWTCPQGKLAPSQLPNKCTSNIARSHVQNAPHPAILNFRPLPPSNNVDVVSLHVGVGDFFVCPAAVSTLLLGGEGPPGEI